MLAFVILVTGSLAANAAIIGFDTPTGASTGGQPVAARATFTTSVNQVTILLENLQANPASIVQCLSGLRFTIGSGENSGSLSSSSGIERNIANDGTYADAGAAATGWSLSTAGSDLKLNLLGTPTSPDHTIIGPPDGSNRYSAGNGSIVNGTHSPFMGLSATFTLSVPGVTAQSTISSVTFQFNTGGNNNVSGNSRVPEPATALSLAGLVVFGAMLRRGRST
jgi:hypothetical protein